MLYIILFPQNLFKKKLFTLLDLCVSSLRRGHANLLCIVPILTDDLRRGSKSEVEKKTSWNFFPTDFMNLCRFACDCVERLGAGLRSRSWCLLPDSMFAVCGLRIKWGLGVGFHSQGTFLFSSTRSDLDSLCCKGF